MIMMTSKFYFKQKNPFGANDLFWGKLGSLRPLRYGGIFGGWGPLKWGVVRELFFQ